MYCFISICTSNALTTCIKLARIDKNNHPDISYYKMSVHVIASCYKIIIHRTLSMTPHIVQTIMTWSIIYYKLCNTIVIKSFFIALLLINSVPIQNKYRTDIKHVILFLRLKKFRVPIYRYTVRASTSAGYFKYIAVGIYCFICFWMHIYDKR